MEHLYPIFVYTVTTGFSVHIWHVYYRTFTDDAAADSLKCNTEKDKNVRLNHRTAGMDVWDIQHACTD